MDLCNMIYNYMEDIVDKFIEFLGPNWDYPDPMYTSNDFGFCSQCSNKCIEYLNWLPFLRRKKYLYGINFNPEDPQYGKLGILCIKDESTSSCTLNLPVLSLIDSYDGKDKYKYVKKAIIFKLK